jgi:hypothetical protein
MSKISSGVYKSIVSKASSYCKVYREAKGNQVIRRQLRNDISIYNELKTVCIYWFEFQMFASILRHIWRRLPTSTCKNTTLLIWNVSWQLDTLMICRLKSNISLVAKPNSTAKFLIIIAWVYGSHIISWSITWCLTIMSYCSFIRNEFMIAFRALYKKDKKFDNQLVFSPFFFFLSWLISWLQVEGLYCQCNHVCNSDSLYCFYHAVNRIRVWRNCYRVQDHPAKQVVFS